MPSKFEGNLLLIMHLLSNALDEIFERLKYETPKIIPAILDAQCFGTVHQTLERALPTEENLEEEASLEMTEEFMMHNESILEVGLADQEEVNLSKKNPKLRSSQRKADLANFDREIFTSKSSSIQRNQKAKMRRSRSRN